MIWSSGPMMTCSGLVSARTRRLRRKCLLAIRHATFLPGGLSRDGSRASHGRTSLGAYGSELLGVSSRHLLVPLHRGQWPLVRILPEQGPRGPDSTRIGTDRGHRPRCRRRSILDREEVGGIRDSGGPGGREAGSSVLATVGAVFALVAGRCRLHGGAVVIGDGAWGSWASAARGRARCWRASRKRMRRADGRRARRLRDVRAGGTSLCGPPRGGGSAAGSGGPHPTRASRASACGRALARWHRRCRSGDGSPSPGDRRPGSTRSVPRSGSRAWPRTWWACTRPASWTWGACRHGD